MPEEQTEMEREIAELCNACLQTVWLLLHSFVQPTDLETKGGVLKMGTLVFKETLLL